MQGIRFPTGFRFRPSREQLVGYYLFNKIYGREGRPFDSAAVLDCDLYSEEPWKIYERFGGTNGRSLFFFTPLKKKTDTDSRNQRKIANGAGTWHGQNLVESFEVTVEDFGIITASKRRFTFKKTGSVENGCWGMIEYSSSLFDEIVVCELINTGIRDARLGRKRKNPMIHEHGSTKMDVKRMRVREANENQPKAALLRVEDVGETGFAVAEESGDDAGQVLDSLSFDGYGLVAESFNPSSGCGEETTFVSKADSGRAHQEDLGGLAQLLDADDYRVSEGAFDEWADYGATTTMTGCFSNWVLEANKNLPKAALLRLEDIGETASMAAEENDDDDVTQILDCLSFEGSWEAVESSDPSPGCVEATLIVSKGDSDRVHQDCFESFMQLLAADDVVFDYCCPSGCDSNYVIPTKEYYFYDGGVHHGGAAATTASSCALNLKLCPTFNG